METCCFDCGGLCWALCFCIIVWELVVFVPVLVLVRVYARSSVVLVSVSVLFSVFAFSFFAVFIVKIMPCIWPIKKSGAVKPALKMKIA